MGLKKGNTNNPNGRPKGRPNKITAEVKELIQDVVNKELEALPERLEEMSNQQRVESLIKLLPYIVPKPQQETNSLNQDTIFEIGFADEPDLSQLTNEELRQLSIIQEKLQVSVSAIAESKPIVPPIEWINTNPS